MTANSETTRGWVTVDAFADAARVDPPRHDIFPVEQWEGGISGVVTLDALRAGPAGAPVDDARHGRRVPCRWSRPVARREVVDLTAAPTKGRVPSSSCSRGPTRRCRERYRPRARHRDEVSHLNPGQSVRPFMARSVSRWRRARRAPGACRSCAALASPISTLARPSLKYTRSGRREPLLLGLVPEPPRSPSGGGAACDGGRIQLAALNAYGATCIRTARLAVPMRA